MLEITYTIKNKYWSIEGFVLHNHLQLSKKRIVIEDGTVIETIDDGVIYVLLLDDTLSYRVLMNEWSKCRRNINRCIKRFNRKKILEKEAHTYILSKYFITI